MDPSGGNENVIRRLLAVGCPVPQDDACKMPPAIVIEIRDAEVTRIHDYRCHVEYIFDLRLTSRSPAEIEIRGFKCRLPWPDPNFTFLGDPRIYTPGEQEQTLPSLRGFRCNEVLNHRKDELGKIKPGDFLEGVLLAWSMDTRVPADYLHGHPASVEIVVVDQLGREHSSPVNVFVDRSATMPAIRTPVRKGLFEDDSEVADDVDVPDQQVTPGDIFHLPANVRRE